jgi:hypothetical protein
MRVLRRRLLAVLVLLAFGGGMIGCDSGGSSSDDSGDPLPAQEAKDEISTVDSDLSANVSDLTDGEAATVLRGLGRSVEVDRGDFTVEFPLWFVLTETLDEQDISLRTSTGTYNWDSEDQSWVEDGGADGNLVLNFPTSPGASGNDATFTRSAYTAAQVTIDGDEENVPTSVSASVTVADVGEVFSVDLSNTAFYDDQIDGDEFDGTQVPKSFLLKILTAPQFHTVQLDSPSKDQFNVEFDLEKGGEGGEKVFGLIADATLTSDFNDVSEIDGIDELAGSIELGPNVTIDYTIDVDGADNLPDDPSAEEINNQFSASVFVNERKAGDIEFAEITEGEETGTLPVFVYPDGEEVLLQNAFRNTFSTILGTGVGDVDFATTAKSAARSVKDALGQLLQ